MWNCVVFKGNFLIKLEGFVNIREVYKFIILIRIFYTKMWDVKGFSVKSAHLHKQYGN